jgi:hypothetical protein
MALDSPSDRAVPDHNVLHDVPPDGDCRTGNRPARQDVCRSRAGRRYFLNSLTRILR